MNIINIRVEDRLPKVVAVSATAVSDNAFRFVFEFDDTWDADALKTIWIVYGDGEYETHPITGNELEVMLGGWPYINIGASQGTKLASRPCKINIQGSIKQLVDEGVQMPSEDQWDTIIEMINQFPGALEAASRAEAAAAESAANLEESKAVLTNVNTAGEAQVKAVRDEGAVQVGNVEDAGSTAVEDVYAAAEAKKTEISDIGTVLVGEQNLTVPQQARVKSNLDAADGIVETASGEVIVLDDASGQHFRGMRVYGKSVQDGVPSPDAPVPIVPVGEDGTVDVAIAGANLYPGEDLSFTRNNRIDLTIPLPPGTYTMGALITSSDTDTAYSSAVALGRELNTLVFINFERDNYSSKSFTIEQDCYAIRFYASGNDSKSAGDTAEWQSIMINRGDTALPWEPYTGQTLSISTPDGLPGIPVSSGGNYTDADGQMWICDEIDFGRGVYVQRIARDTLDGNSSVILVDSLKMFEFVLSANSKQRVSGHGNEGMCNAYAVYRGLKSADFADGEVWVSPLSVTALKNRLYSRDARFSTPEDYKVWLAENPVTVLYEFETPIETPLSETELAAYRALRTNKPNTTIFADDNAGVAVDYVADTKRYIDKKFAELAAAIIN